MKSIFYIHILLLFAINSFTLSQEKIFDEQSMKNDSTGVIVSVKDSGKVIAINSENKKQELLNGTKVNMIKFSTITGFTIGAAVWLHNYQRSSWWAGQRGQFHIQNDWAYSMSADKLGHFFDGAFIHKLYSGAFEWSGFSKKTSMWMGALFSLAYMTDIEIEDGFAHDWGFSPGDELFNTMGAFYPVLQNACEPLTEFNFKWSYFPSKTLTEGIKKGAFLDDYDGQTMWLSIGIHRYLPKSVQKYWPDFFNIAFGYGVKEHITDHGYQNWYIALDYDFRKMIPGNSKFMVWLKDVLNHFRILPAPGIRINKYGTEYVINF